MELRPLAGGYSGETFVADDPSAPGGRVVTRIYLRHPERMDVDAALLDLLRGLLPVPRVIERRRPEGAQPGVLVMEWMPGVRLEDLLREPPPGLDLAAVGASVGEVLTTLLGVPFANAGLFVDAELRVDRESLAMGLHDWVGEQRTSTRLASWSDEDFWHLEGLVELADVALHGLGPAAVDTFAMLPDRADRVVLVHSDFNPKNILVDPATGHVTALLDWEFAHAGSPFTDLGNLTRFERDERLLRPVLETVGRRLGIDDHDRLLRLGRALDLWALVELAGRPGDAPVPRLATELLLAQARGHDLLAWPWSTNRVDLPV